MPFQPNQISEAEHVMP